MTNINIPSSKWTTVKENLQQCYNNLSLKHKVDIKRKLRKTTEGPIRVDELGLVAGVIKTLETHYV